MKIYYRKQGCVVVIFVPDNYEVEEELKAAITEITNKCSNK